MENKTAAAIERNRSRLEEVEQRIARMDRIPGELGPGVREIYRSLHQERADFIQVINYLEAKES